MKTKPLYDAKALALWARFNEQMRRGHWRQAALIMDQIEALLWNPQ